MVYWEVVSRFRLYGGRLVACTDVTQDGRDSPLTSGLSGKLGREKGVLYVSYKGNSAEDVGDCMPDKVIEGTSLSVLTAVGNRPPSDPHYCSEGRAGLGLSHDGRSNV